MAKSTKETEIKNNNSGVRTTKYSNGAVAILVVDHCHICEARNYEGWPESRGVWEVNFKGIKKFLCDGCKSQLDNLDAHYLATNPKTLDEFLKGS